MKDQKVIITDQQAEINDLIDRGWKVVSVTASSIAIVNQPVPYTTPDIAHGKFCFVLEFVH